MPIRIPVLIFIAALGGVAYRAGGSGRFPRWTRTVAMGILPVAAMTALGGWHWSLLICGGLTAGASSTYFKKKGTDAVWFNWMFVGLAFSVAMLPWAWMTGHWMGFLIRSITVTGGITLWSQLIGWDVAEEFGRGAIEIGTLPLLFLGG